MKITFYLAAVALAFALGNVGHSQAPAAPQTSLQRLDSLRTKNKQLIDRQLETLKRLDELQLQSQQIKFLGKRS